MEKITTIGLDIAKQVFQVHGVDAAGVILVRRKLRRDDVIGFFEEVHLPHPEDLYDRYPGNLSGGQRQRVMIATALLCGPKLLIADEPTTALDVTTQMHILRLLKDLQQERRMSMIFVTHDFGVVAEIADSVVVMREGKIVEAGSKLSVLNSPRHDYTRSLLRDLRDTATPDRPSIDAPRFSR